MAMRAGFKVLILLLATAAVILVLGLESHAFIGWMGEDMNIVHAQASSRRPFADYGQDQRKCEILQYQHSRNFSNMTTADLDGILKSEKEISYLAGILTERLNSVTIKPVKFNPTCASKETIANSCDGSPKCLRMSLPTDVRLRVSQLLTPKRLQLTPQINDILEEMRQKLPGQYDLILVTGASSNHYLESQAMIQTVHENVLPHYKNFSFVYYNIGLTAKERSMVAKHCRCTVIDFPFEKFPKFMLDRHCYSWKPLLIKAHAQQANVLIWADASIRFRSNKTELDTFIRETRERGVQFPSGPSYSPYRTFRRMYHFFGDEPCAYFEMWQAGSGLGGFARDPLIERAVLEPWAACSAQRDCMCRGDENKPPTPVLDCTLSNTMIERWKANTAKIKYGLCHRFDQAVVSIILHKLYGPHYRWIFSDGFLYVDVRRDHKVHYFPSS